MQKTPPTTLSQLAQVCNVSVATVSRALSGHVNVKDDVRRRVLAAAEQLGYRRNQLVSSLMGQVRGARSQHFTGNLAIVHVPSSEQPQLRPMQHRIINAAKSRAAELGFSVELFSLNRQSGGPASLGRMLRARGIAGVIFIQPNSNDATRGFPWQHFASLQIDYGAPLPDLHTVSLDHHLTLNSALARLRTLGYRKAGMFIERHKDERLIHKWSAAFRSFQENQGGIGHLPVLKAETITREEFMAWHRKFKPDLIIGHLDIALTWLQAEDKAHAVTPGFFNLNWNERNLPCAGLDLQPDLHGIVAAEVIAAQIQRNERGLPDDPRMVNISGKWVDGPTIRNHPAPCNDAVAC